ncbi:RsmB/NOP family class I SAM-dependent RNA methyltransferase [Pseudoalteromonas peptidolytica]|uniref:RsmB/NOP family class I SAM-dependent RNA methyltransferase n=1 Tax=Pseudoalteromonas peptidolytica TaxID=61150 RepID=UPI00298DEE92|nr:RsmB/NOP family class I SAM-dependent RNA methyltransferase [Pseudoalteromonas peptidolytica]MDW7548975.1 RsmB/NOP family class I SAM-dependent RNA methyltransferase [Pseudoalteromonas peptidolytica]
MSVTRALVQTLSECIEHVLDTSLHADKALTQLLQNNPQWSLDERQYAVSNYYHIFRFKRLLTYLLEHENLPLDGFGYWLTCQAVTKQALPEWVDTERYHVERLQSLIEQAPEAIRLSLPDWLNEVAHIQLGEKWQVIANALNQSAQQYLRVNTLKSDIATVTASLAKEGIKVSNVELDAHIALKVESNSHLFRSQAFQSGWFEMQDAGSQQIAPFLDVKPGHKVVDACAGAGGKSLHLAALMENKGRLLSLDIHEHKLETLKQRAKRAGVHVAETRVIQNNKTIKRQKEKFDRVLLDVPCSGLGVLKRNPDAKWHLNSQNLDTLIDLQTDILARYSQMCKVGGKLVYATCSILPAENEQQVERFLENNPNWQLEDSLCLLPGINSEFDGFYAARLVKNS